jgi:hypothetical protein
MTTRRGMLRLLAAAGAACTGAPAAALMQPVRAQARLTQA